MTSTLRDLLRRLADVEPLEMPPGEPGITSWLTNGSAQQCAPVLSVYLDLHPEAQGGSPGLRPWRPLMRQRLHQIEQSFQPRGMALDAVRADRVRIQRYLDATVPESTRSIAIFASDRHGLFEVFRAEVAFTDQVSAASIPDLCQLARLLESQDVAAVALVHTHAARLFAVHRGGLREIQRLMDDPKLFHMVHGTQAMNQAHYQRHAGRVRAEFATEVADRLADLVDREGAILVVLAGDAVAVPLLRRALAPRIARLVHEPPLSLDLAAPHDEILEEVAPLLEAVEADRERGALARLLDAVRSGALGVAGLEPTIAALRTGAVDTLILADAAPLSPETRNELIDLSVGTDAEIVIVARDEALRRLGGVGALLRYRVGAPTTVSSAIAQAEETPDSARLH